MSRNRKKWSKKRKRIVLIALITVLVLLTGFLVYRGLVNRQKNIVMTCGDLKLTNTDFAYFFWTEVNSRYNQESGQAGPDTTLTLDVQMYDENTTWEEFLIADIVPRVQEQMSLYMAAQAEGFQMPAEAQAQCDSILEDFRQLAEEMQYKDLTAYLIDTFGPDSSEKSFKKYLQYTCMADAYAEELFNRTAPTDEQAAQYYDTWRSMYQEGDLETAKQDLHQEEYYNAIAKAKAQYPIAVKQENIVITLPHGAHLQTEEHASY